MPEKLMINDEADRSIWVAAQVKAKLEFFVSVSLHAKGYETFVPTYLTSKRWADRIKDCEQPLISGYVFVRTRLDSKEPSIVRTPGVVRMVGFGGQIARIDPEELERIRVLANCPLRTEPWPYFKQGMAVRIAQGSLAGMQGRVVRTKRGTLLVVSIDILQRSVAVQIDHSWVEPLDKEAGEYRCQSEGAFAQYI